MIRWLLSRIFGRESVFPEAAAESVLAAMRELVETPA